MAKFNKLEAFDTFRWKRIAGATFDGKFDMPCLQAVSSVEPRNLIPFHLAKSAKNVSNSWYHFYEDDYQFERIWNNPDRYLEMLSKFEGGISPDFSIYLDMPRSQQIWNAWRNRAMTYYFQTHGLQVIPNVGWSDYESLSWAFDGIPEKSILSITTQGCMGSDYVSKQSLLNGIHELAIQKYPATLYIYGEFPKRWMERFPMPIVTLPTFSKERWRS